MRILSVLKSLLATAATILPLGGCAFPQDQAPPNTGLPNWVVTPEVENALADSACVPSSGHFSVDKAHAISEARNALLQQIEVRAASLTKLTTDKATNNNQATVTTHYRNTARQLAEGYLQGSRADKIDTFTVNGQQQLCARVVIDSDMSQALAQQLINQIEPSADTKKYTKAFMEANVQSL